MKTFNSSESSGLNFSVDLPDKKIGHGSTKFTESDDTISEIGSGKQADKGSKKKRGKSSGNQTTSANESSMNTQESSAVKSKKNQRKGKDSSDSKATGKKESVKTREDNIPPEEWVRQKIAVLVPDFEEQGLLILSLSH